MAGALVKIDEVIVTSADSTVSLTGIDSTYDVYMVKLYNLSPSTDAIPLLRVQEGGVTKTDSEFDRAGREFYSNTAFGNESNTNESQTNLTTESIEADSGKGLNGIIYIFNANNASEYTFLTIETSGFRSTGEAIGLQGGAVWTRTTAVDGIEIRYSTGNIDSGACVLYGFCC